MIRKRIVELVPDIDNVEHQGDNGGNHGQAASHWQTVSAQSVIPDWESMTDDEMRRTEPWTFGPCPHCQTTLWRGMCGNCRFGT